MHFRDNQYWINQKDLAEFFQVDTASIHNHIKNLFKSGALDVSTNMQRVKITQQEGGRQITRSIQYFTIDVMIAIGFKINSLKAMEFRIKMGSIIKLFMTKALILDDTRLKQINNSEYDDLLELIDTIKSIKS